MPASAGFLGPGRITLGLGNWGAPVGRVFRIKYHADSSGIYWPELLRLVKTTSSTAFVRKLIKALGVPMLDD